MLQQPSTDTIVVEGVSDVAATMAAAIVRACHPLQVILFGSHARGEAGPASDVDLLVVVPNGADRRQASTQARLAASPTISMDFTTARTSWRS